MYAVCSSSKTYVHAVINFGSRLVGIACFFDTSMLVCLCDIFRECYLRRLECLNVIRGSAPTAV